MQGKSATSCDHLTDPHIPGPATCKIILLMFLPTLQNVKQTLLQI